MYQRNAMLITATSGASITVLTGPGYMGGMYFYASGAAATITVADSGRQILSWSGAAGATYSFTPVMMIALTGGLSVTNSGAGTYAVMYATQ